MKVTLWGVRGSIPTPGPKTVRYGGNTTCISIATESGALIILDGGSGIRELGLSLLGGAPVDCQLFISHTHWDHIQGLPFFVPLFIPGSTVRIYGAFDPVYQKDLKSILSAQMEYCYFPVRSNELKAEITYDNLAEGRPVETSGVSVTPIVMNHPVLTFGYRIIADGKKVFFTGDHEPIQNIYPVDDPDHAEYQRIINAKEAQLVEFIRDADLIIADAQYTAEEYPNRIGWGHATPDFWISMANRSNASRLILTHHDPTRSDDAIDSVFAACQERLEWRDSLSVSMAVEGTTVTL